MDNSENFNWNSFSPNDLAVLCFIQQSDKVLLIEKKRGLGAGKVNGPGGKLENGETYAEAAIRETEEEVGLKPLNPQWNGTLDFAFTDGYHLTVRVFTSRKFTGKLMETPEANPFWVDRMAIPFNRMWDDDRLWLPFVLDGHRITGRFVFDGDLMLDSDIRFGTLSTGFENLE